MKNNKLILLLTVIFALLIIPGGVFADSDDDYDLGYDEGVDFYDDEPGYDDSDDAYDDYEDEFYDDIEDEVDSKSTFKRGFEAGYEDAQDDDEDDDYDLGYDEGVDFYDDEPDYSDSDDAYDDYEDDFYDDIEDEVDSKSTFKRGFIAGYEDAQDDDDDYDLGYDEGVDFYDDEPDYSDSDDAYDEYEDDVLDDDIEDEIDSWSTFKRGFEAGYEDAQEEDDDDYDLGYDEGVDFYDDEPGYTDTDDAYDDYYDNYLDDDTEDEIDSKTKFKKGFEAGYEDAQEEVAEGDYAEDLGLALGAEYALEDFYDGEESDWKHAMPSDNSISNRYDLDRMTTAYESRFINEFEDAFQEGYINAYEEILLNPPYVSMDQGLEDGKADGQAMGILAAEKDYLYKNSMDDERNLLSDGEITERYRLSLGNDEYEDAFIQSFKKEYMIAYNERFRALSQEDSLIKSISAIITPAGGYLETEGNVKVTVEAGTFYMPIMLTINTRNTSYYTSLTYKRASEMYGITLDSSTGTIDETKPITISFPYYGDKNKAGIYKLVNGKWSYLPSNVEDDVISAEILPSTLSAYTEGIYAVFMDDSIRVLTDVRGHWAEEEIETMVRRDIITGYPGSTSLDGTFAPEQPVTRAEFLILLSRAQNWTLPKNYIANASYFTDYQDFQSYGDIISYALSQKYIYGYPDLTFKPYNSISYSEVELIMSRVLYQNGFTWNSIAEQIMYDKGYKSSSFQNKNGKITRAEVAYMLYVLNQYRY